MFCPFLLGHVTTFQKIAECHDGHLVLVGQKSVKFDKRGVGMIGDNPTDFIFIRSKLQGRVRDDIFSGPMLPVSCRCFFNE